MINQDVTLSLKMTCSRTVSSSHALDSPGVDQTEATLIIFYIAKQVFIPLAP